MELLLYRINLWQRCCECLLGLVQIVLLVSGPIPNSASVTVYLLVLLSEGF